MSATFESEKNRKAFTYTAIICAVLLLLALLISWKLPETPPPIVQELIEINLGNNDEGYGEVQPLIKGAKAPNIESAEQQQSTAAKNQVTDDVKTDDVTDKESAPVTKPVKATTKVPVPATVITATPKPQKPKIAGYNGPQDGKGNGATEDNGYKYQGNNPNGKGDSGNPNGNPDSYGNTPGGKAGGPRIIGNRTIIKYYAFTGDLPKAVVNAIVKVSPDGKGTFMSFGKGSTTRESRYVTAMANYLKNVEFNKTGSESTITVVFNFTEN